MDKADILKKMDALIQQLEHWNYEYYVEDHPSVPDHVYDRTIAELERLEAQYPELKRPDSPTQHVGGGFGANFSRFPHPHPMMSLQNGFSLDELTKFSEDVRKVYPSATWVTEPKIDGLSINLVYRHGRLAYALTRGDGVEGENVLKNIRQIPHLPQTIPTEEECEIRGEVYMDNHDFALLNASLPPESHFANPRNAAAGTLRNLDAGVVEARHLRALFYYTPDPEQLQIHSQWELIQWLRHHGFPTATEIAVHSTWEGVLQAIRAWQENRHTMPYQIDGVVIKVNEYAAYPRLGATAKFPRWAIAYKFPPVVGRTRVKKIRCEVGRTGKITYVGELDPIELDGSKVASVTLNNADYIQRKGLNLNDTIEIFKAGDIIPYFDRVVERPTTEIPFVPQTSCPSCGSPLHQKDVEQFCENADCPEQQIMRLIYFVSKPCLDIRGLSEQTIRKLWGAGIIQNIPDIFQLPQKRAAILNGNFKIKDKTMDNLTAQLTRALGQPFARWLNAVGIPNLGRVMAKKLAEQYHNFEALRQASANELQTIPDVGQVVATGIVQWFANPRNQELVRALNDLHPTFIQEAPAVGSVDQINSPYRGKTFVITGTFPQPRGEIEEYLGRVYGINFAGAVSRKTDYLLCGEGAGAKLARAEELGIPVIREIFWKTNK